MKDRRSESMPGESEGNFLWVLILPQLAMAPARSPAEATPFSAWCHTHFPLFHTMHT